MGRPDFQPPAPSPFAASSPPIGVAVSSSVRTGLSRSLTGPCGCWCVFHFHYQLGYSSLENRLLCFCLSTNSFGNRTQPQWRWLGPASACELTLWPGWCCRSWRWEPGGRWVSQLAPVVFAGLR